MDAQRTRICNIDICGSECKDGKFESRDKGGYGGLPGDHLRIEFRFLSWLGILPLRYPISWSILSLRRFTVLLPFVFRRTAPFFPLFSCRSFISSVAVLCASLTLFAK